MGRTDDPQAVDDYLGALPEPRRAALQRLREIVLRAAPGAAERVAYGIPIVSLGNDVVGFSAAKRHLSLHVMSTTLVAATLERHPELKGSGATLHFTEDTPLDAHLIEDLVAARLTENQEHRDARGR